MSPSGEAMISPGSGSGTDRPRSVSARYKAGLACLIVAAGAAAQPTKTAGRQPKSLPEVVPASAGLFVQLNELMDTSESARARNARDVYRLLIGSSSSLDEPAIDWQRLVLRSLGIGADQAQELFARKLAVAAPSWKRLSEGMILVHVVADDPLINDIFAPLSIKSAQFRGPVMVYKTRTGLSAATDGQILILAQNDKRGSLFNFSVWLMEGRAKASLGADPEFAKWVDGLPPDRDGLMYLSLPKAEPSEDSANWLALTRVVIGLYVRPDHVEFACRAERPVGTAPRLGVAALKRLGQLPQTTVAAWCTQIDVRDLFKKLLGASPGDAQPQYLRIVADVFGNEDILQRIAGGLGPDAIVTWDQHLGAGPSIPQVAVILESKDASACAETCAEAMQSVVDWLDLKNRDHPGRRLRLHRSEYLGTMIYELSLPGDSVAADSGNGQAGLLVPAFAAVEDVLVVALSSDHIRNIVDARYGFTPSVADLPDFRLLEGDSGTPAMIALAQPALAARVVDDWFVSPDGPVARWFTEALQGKGAARTPPHPPVRLGVGTKPGTHPGTVLVARVHPGQRADGLLQAGDEICAVNGQVLALADATSDLRRSINQPTPDGRWVFRVQRDGDVLDVAVPATPIRQVSQFATDPTGAIRQLQSLFRLVDFAVTSVSEPTPDTVSARLTLRFALPPAPDTD